MSGILPGMLFMVIERFRAAQGGIDAVGARFRERGRLMPADVLYVASWVDPAGTTCWQLMEAPTREALAPWTRAWEDLVEFEIVPVRTSAEFWAERDTAPPPEAR